MTIDYRKAAQEDAQVLADIYNAAYYSDYVRYGACPGYGNTKESMEKSIIDFPKYVILCDNEPVGCISCKQVEGGLYEIGNLCIIPEYQGKGIGTQVFGMMADLLLREKGIGIITASSMIENRASARALEKNGFTLVVHAAEEDWGFGTPTLADKWIL